MPDSDNENTEPELHNEETINNQYNNDESNDQENDTDGENNNDEEEENDALEENDEEQENDAQGENDEEQENDSLEENDEEQENDAQGENDEEQENDSLEENDEEQENDAPKGNDEDEDENDNEEENDDEEENNDEEESDDDTETTEEEIQFFKATIKDYLKLEEEIKVLQKGISQRRKKKNNLSDVILTFLQEKDISHVNLQGNFAGRQMKCNNKVSKSKLSDAEIRNVFNDFFKDDEMGDNKVEQLMEIMESKKKIKEVSKLEINKIGGRKKKNASEQLSSIINDTSDGNEDSEAIPEHLQYLYNT
mgnify:CR=1 FL=1